MTKKEMTVKEWIELLEKSIKRVNESMECVRRFKETDDIERLKEAADWLSLDCAYTKQAFIFMEHEGIK